MHGPTRQYNRSGKLLAEVDYENGKASLQYFVKPGDMLNKKIEIIAEIPTYFGNIMAKRLLGEVLEILRRL